MKKTFALFSLLCVLALTLAACAAPGSGAASLSGTDWKLASYGPAAAPQAAAADIQTHLTFSPDGTLSGNMGCNGFSGTYTLQADGQINFGTIMSTLMACPDPQMAQEGATFQVLKGTAVYKLEGSTLTITSEDGKTVLVLTKA